MPQPLDGRVLFAVPVQVIGVTPSGTAFSETAYTIDVSRYGVRLDRVPFLRRPGDHVTLRYGESSARYRVAWVGAPDTPHAGQAGLTILDGEPFLWGTEPPAQAEHRDQPVADNPHCAPPPAILLGILHNEDSVLKVLRCWFEENSTLTRDQFWRLLEGRERQK